MWYKNYRNTNLSTFFPWAESHDTIEGSKKYQYSFNKFGQCGLKLDLDKEPTTQKMMDFNKYAKFGT